MEHHRSKNQRIPNLISLTTDNLLATVKTPAQYIGGEINQINKTPKPGDVSVALAFPDTYTIGMSHLGLSILYAAVNAMPGAFAHRVFCPWIDAADTMKTHNIPLSSLETHTPIRQYDILAITLQHELAYTNILYMLDLAGITFIAVDRHDDEPLVIGGGPMADCCEPVADFFDLVVLGDGEEALPALIEAYQVIRKQKPTRRELLCELARRFPFVYVPQLYDCQYNHDGTLNSCTPITSDIPTCVTRAAVDDLDAAIFPVAPIVSHTETVHDRIAIEVMRGCPHRCAFCHAGHTKGRVRYRSIDKILDIAQKSYSATGHDTISLLSLSTSDYPHLDQLLGKLYDQFQNCRVGISLPSLRVDSHLRDVPSSVASVRREGLTIAVETANDIMRKAIGKSVTDDDLLATMAAAYQAGWRKVKLYFMAGFPHETQDDIVGIVDLAARISRLRREFTNYPADVNVAISWLIPKPHTPFAWIPQQSVEYFGSAKKLLIDTKRQLKGVPIRLKFHHMERSILEGVFARGDRRLSSVLQAVYDMGAKFDSWDECFDHNRYFDAFEQCGIDPSFYTHRTRSPNETLPWHHLAGSNHKSLHNRLKQILNTIQTAHGL